MPYTAEIVTITGALVEVDVEADTEDEPFFRRADFALALIVPDGDSPLGRAIGYDRLCEALDGTLDPRPWLKRHQVRVARRGDPAADIEPCVTYRLELTSSEWVSHLEAGQVFEVFAYCRNGPEIAKDALWVEQDMRVVPVYSDGDRVQLRRRIGLDAVRGTVIDEHALAPPPPRWRGSETLYQVHLDHGPVAWAPGELIDAAPTDTYERAFDDPDRWFDELLTMHPLARAETYGHLAPITGGNILQPTDDPLVSDVEIPACAARIFALVRRLPWPYSLQVAVKVAEDWTNDQANRAAYVTCLDLQIGALVLLLAERSMCTSPTTALDAVPREWLTRLGSLAANITKTGTGRSFGRRVDYLGACAVRYAAPIHDALLRGNPPEREAAAKLGLDGALLRPNEEDLYR